MTNKSKNPKRARRRIWEAKYRAKNSKNINERNKYWMRAQRVKIRKLKKLST